MSAQKFDADKARMELLPPEAMEKVARVFTYGAKKYAPWNFRKGMARTRLLGAALRHLFSWSRGEEQDSESGESHLAHAACCVLMLLDAELLGYGEDDRGKVCEVSRA